MTEQLFGSASIVSVVVSLTVLAGFFYARQKSAKEQGANEQKLINLARDLEHAWDKIHEIDRDQNRGFTALGKLEARLDSIDSHLERIEAKLEVRG